MSKLSIKNKLGRFISEDPIKGSMTSSQSQNPYVYCMNNPLRFIDPSGMLVTDDPGSVDGYLQTYYGGEYHYYSAMDGSCNVPGDGYNYNDASAQRKTFEDDKRYGLQNEAIEKKSSIGIPVSALYRANRGGYNIKETRLEPYKTTSRDIVLAIYTKVSIGSRLSEPFSEGSEIVLQQGIVGRINEEVGDFLTWSNTPEGEISTGYVAINVGYTLVEAGAIVAPVSAGGSLVVSGIGLGIMAWGAMQSGQGVFDLIISKW